VLFVLLARDIIDSVKVSAKELFGLFYNKSKWGVGVSRPILAGLFGVLCAASIVCAAVGRDVAGYRVVQTVALTGSRIQILEDARLDDQLAAALWRDGVDPMMALGEKHPRTQIFEKAPPKPAKLRQVDSRGRSVLEILLEHEAPLAKIENRRLGDEGHPTLLVTTDNDAGFGSYSGQVTRLYELRDRRISQVRALGRDQRTEPVELVNTLKSGWRISGGHGRPTVIEQWLCRPDFSRAAAEGQEPFELIFKTYVFDGAVWRMAQRRKAGFWEGEGPWPSSEFPKPPSSSVRASGR
jgi:hypothetical protein